MASPFDGEFTQFYRRHGQGDLVAKADFVYEEDLGFQPELPSPLESLLAEPSSTDASATQCFRLKHPPLSTPTTPESRMEAQPARVIPSKPRIDVSELLAAAEMTQANRVSTPEAKIGGTAMRSVAATREPYRLDPLVVRVIGAMLFLHLVEAIILIILVMKR